MVLPGEGQEATVRSGQVPILLVYAAMAAPILLVYVAMAASVCCWRMIVLEYWQVPILLAYAPSSILLVYPPSARCATGVCTVLDSRIVLRAVRDHDVVPCYGMLGTEAVVWHYQVWGA
eukprot:3273829-Rhodomonas_salina.1